MCFPSFPGVMSFFFIFHPRFKPFVCLFRFKRYDWVLFLFEILSFPILSLLLLLLLFNIISHTFQAFMLITKSPFQVLSRVFVLFSYKICDSSPEPLFLLLRLPAPGPSPPSRAIPLSPLTPKLPFLPSRSPTAPQQTSSSSHMHLLLPHVSRGDHYKSLTHVSCPLPAPSHFPLHVFPGPLSP